MFHASDAFVNYHMNYIPLNRNLQTDTCCSSSSSSSNNNSSSKSSK